MDPLTLAMGIITACAPEIMELAGLAIQAAQGKTVDPAQVKAALDNFHAASDAQIAQMQADHDAEMKAAEAALATAPTP